MEWTTKQQQVIDTTGRDLLVSAAAGSGKTAVLVERIITMITDPSKDVNIDELLVVTFTRAAAAEMKERIREALEKAHRNNPKDENINKQLAFIHNAHISTIDSFCGSIVRENFDKVDLDPNFRIADETEIEMLKTDILEALIEEGYESADEEFMHLAEQYSAGKVQEKLSELVDTLYKKASGDVNPRKWIENCVNYYDYADIDEFNNSDIMKRLLDLVYNQVSCLLSEMNKCREMAQTDADLYIPVIDGIINDLKLLLNTTDYTGFRNIIKDMTVSAMPRKKPSGSPEKQAVIKGVRAGVKDVVDNLRDKLFKEPIEQIYSDIAASKRDVSQIVKLTLEFMDRFQKEKLEKNIMDFNDQAHFALYILNDFDDEGNRTPSETARILSKQFKEVMIDEYQDSNSVQEYILSAICNGYGTNNMFMVGDVKQSIYRFRQAEPALFLGKVKKYSDDLTDEQVKIILDTNFRSREEVINSVNYIFDYIMHENGGQIDYKDGNRLSLGASYDEPPTDQNNDTEFVIIDTKDKEVEAAWVAQKIAEITNPVTGMKITEPGKGMRPVRYSDIAILLRTMKGVSDVYVNQLENNKIPSYADSKTGYYEAMEVRTIMDYLNVIDNPRQDIPLVASMRSPMFSFSDEELATIKVVNDVDSFYDCARLYCENGEDDELVKKLNYYFKMLDEFREMIPYTSVHDLINIILEKTNYEYYIRSMVNGKKRMMNIQALKDKAVLYEGISYKGLFNFVRYIEKLKSLSKDDGEASAVSENDNIVKIMSIHKSKGLQFPVVFVCNTDGQFKSDTDAILANDDGIIGVDFIDSNTNVKAPTLIKTLVSRENKYEDRAELLRVLYVALTRAKEKLFITGKAADANKKMSDFSKSAYMDDTLMPFMDVVDTSNMLDWIGQAVGKSYVMDLFRTEDVSFKNKENEQLFNSQCNIKPSALSVDEIQMETLTSQITDEIRQEKADLIEKTIVPEDIKEILEKNFSFEYPFKEDIYLYSKASVTEIKQQSLHDEEQDGERLHKHYDPKESDYTPSFAREVNDEGRLFGAKRGTAYHRFFELMDMTVDEYTKEYVKAQVEQFVEKGLMAEDEGRAIYPNDVIAFTKTNLYKRMKAAEEKGLLFREKSFLLGYPANKITKSNSEETMIIQGIIDVCFIEDGKYVIADYKTDKTEKETKEEALQELVDKYKKQLECYKIALEQIGEIEVKELIIYSVTQDDEITIKED